MTIYLNGKFTVQRTTGVQRVAGQLVRALDECVQGRWVLLCPAGGSPPALRRIEARCVGPAGLPPTLWEQCVLPWAARDGVLLNLAGAAPALARCDRCACCTTPRCSTTPRPTRAASPSGTDGSSAVSPARPWRC